jgi:arylsulfatase A-like enzyme
VNARKTTRRDFLSESAAATAALAVGHSGLVSASLPPEKRPNIVLIFADDLGYCDSGLYGCDAIPMPNVKRIADEGVLFTDGYVTSPVCSPSRAGLITGRYQQRFGHEFLPSDDIYGLPVDETTLADAMRSAGYVTGIVGKWHLGVREEFNPLNRGFDEFFGVIDWGSDYANPTREDVRSSRPGRKAEKAPKPTPESPWKIREDYPVMRGTDPVNEDQYLTDVLTREAVAFIEKHKSQSFFLYVPYTAVHQPLQVTQKYYDRFPNIEDESARIYAAMASSLDDGVGAILDALEETGLEENTLVIFASDNGAGVAEYCSNAPLRMGKHTLFEGGVRVPFCMKWPGQIPEGTTYKHPVSTLDIFPTAMAAAGGGEHATDKPGDGVDLMPYLKEATRDRPHDVLFWRGGSNWAVRAGNWKLIHAGDRDWLYDLSEDIGEQSDLAAERPELVKKLRNAHERWNSEMIDPLWPPTGSKTAPQFSVDGTSIEWAV